MKKLSVAAAALATLIGTPALAADMALKASPPAPSCAWCGWYVGGNVGYGWGEKTDPNLSVLSDGVGAGGGIATFLTTGFPGLPGGNLFPNLKPSGALGGLQVGYDRQYANWVLGVVADIQAADWSATNKVTTPAATGANVDETLGANVRWFGTVRARAGVTTNNVLFYGTGGLGLWASRRQRWLHLHTRRYWVRRHQLSGFKLDDESWLGSWCGHRDKSRVPRQYWTGISARRFRPQFSDSLPGCYSRYDIHRKPADRQRSVARCLELRVLGFTSADLRRALAISRGSFDSFARSGIPEPDEMLDGA